jgi:hypothetical protein
MNAHAPPPTSNRYAGHATAGAEVAATERARVVERSNLAAVLPQSELPHHPGAPRLPPD